MSKTKDIIDEALGAVELAKSEPKERKVNLDLKIMTT